MTEVMCMRCRRAEDDESGCGGFYCAADWLCDQLTASPDYRRLGADYSSFTVQAVAHILSGWGADVRELTSDLHDRARPRVLVREMLQARPDVVSIPALAIPGGSTWFGPIAWDAIVDPMRAGAHPRNAARWLQRVAPVYQDTLCLQRVLTVSRLAGAGRASELVEELLPDARPPAREPSRLAARLKGVA